jgi:hypothetical protein
MARDTHGRIVRGETAAFEKLAAALHHAAEAAEGLSRRLTTGDLQKLTAALRHCIEASTEISTWRSDPRWFALTPAFERLLSAAGRAYLMAAQNGGSAIPAWRWGAMAIRFRGMLEAATSLWAEAEQGGVQGAQLS